MEHMQSSPLRSQDGHEPEIENNYRCVNPRRLIRELSKHNSRIVRETTEPLQDIDENNNLAALTFKNIAPIIIQENNYPLAPEKSHSSVIFTRDSLVPEKSHSAVIFTRDSLVPEKNYNDVVSTPKPLPNFSNNSVSEQKYMCNTPRGIINNLNIDCDL
jgi:hypothetical protein